MPVPPKASSAYLRPITSASRQRPPRNHFQPRPLRTVDRSEVAVGAAMGVFFNGTLLVCCGAVGGAPSSTVRFLPLFGDGETGWTAVECGLAQGVSTPPAPRMYAITALFRGRLIMLGGDSGAGAAIQDCWALNMSADARIWTPLTMAAAHLIPSRCAYAQLSDGVILAQGGLDGSGAVTADLVLIDLVNHSVRRLGTCGPTGRLSGHTMGICPRRSSIVLCGGVDAAGVTNTSVIETYVHDLAGYKRSLFAKGEKTAASRAGSSGHRITADEGVAPAEEGDTESSCPQELPTRPIADELPDDYCDGYPMLVRGCGGASPTVVWAGPRSTWEVALPPPIVAAEAPSDEDASATPTASPSASYSEDFSSIPPTPRATDADSPRHQAPHRQQQATEPANAPAESRPPTTSPGPEEPDLAAVALRPDSAEEEPELASWAMVRQRRSGVPPVRDGIRLDHGGTVYLIDAEAPVAAGGTMPSVLSADFDDADNDADDDEPPTAGTLYSFAPGKAGWSSRPIAVALSVLRLPPRPQLPSGPPRPPTSSVANRSSRGMLVPSQHLPPPRCAPSPAPTVPALSASARRERSETNERRRIAMLTPMPPPPPATARKPSAHAPASATRRPASVSKTSRSASREVNRRALISFASSRPGLRAKGLAERGAVAIKRASNEPSAKSVDLSLCDVLDGEDLTLLRAAVLSFPRLSAIHLGEQRLAPFEAGLLVDLARDAPHLKTVVCGADTLPSTAHAEDLEHFLRQNIVRSEHRKWSSIAKRHRMARSKAWRRITSELAAEEACARRRLFGTIDEEWHRVLTEAVEEACLADLRTDERLSREDVEDRLAAEQKRVADEIIARCAAAMAVVEADVAAAYETEHKQFVKELTETQRRERNAYRQIAEHLRRIRKKEKGEREDLERVERTGRTDIRVDEDRWKQLYSVYFGSMDAKHRLLKESQKRLRVQREGEERREREKRRAQEEQRRQEEEEVQRKRKAELERMRAHEEQERGSIITGERQDWQRQSAMFRDEKGAIERRDNFKERCRQRDLCGDQAPSVHVTGMPQSSRLVRGSCVPAVVAKVGVTELDPRLVLALVSEPPYFADLHAPTVGSSSSSAAGSLASSAKPRRRSRSTVVAAREPITLEVGEVTKDGYISQKTSIQGGTISVALSAERPENHAGLSVLLVSPTLTLRGDLGGETGVDVLDNASGLVIATATWSTSESQLTLELCPAGCGPAMVNTLLSSIALQQPPLTTSVVSPRGKGSGHHADDRSHGTATPIHETPGMPALAISSQSAGASRRSSMDSTRGDLPPPLKTELPVTVDMRVTVSLLFPVYRTAPPSQHPSLAGSIVDTTSPQQQLSASTRGGEHAAQRPQPLETPPLRSEWRHLIQVDVYPVVCAMDGGLSISMGTMSASSPSMHSSRSPGGSPQAGGQAPLTLGSVPIYTEGEGEVKYWDRLHIELSDRLPPLAGASAVVAIDTDVDPLDCIVLRTVVGGRLQWVEAESGAVSVTFDGDTVADLTVRGPLVLACTLLDAATGMPFLTQPEVRPRPRKLVNDSAVALRLTTHCKHESLMALFAALRFLNTSQNPVEGTRRLRIGLSYPTGLQSFAPIEFILVGIDDPTVIDMGVSRVPYRVPPQLPQQLDDYVAPQPCHVAALCSVVDVDTTDFEGGYLKVTITNPRRGDRLGFEPPERSDVDVLSPPLNETSMEGTPAASEAVLFRDEEIGTLTFSNNSTVATVDFMQSSIEAVEAIYKCITFAADVRTKDDRDPTHQPDRLVVFSLKCGTAENVHSSVHVGIAAPLLSVPMSNAFWTYREKSGFVPVGAFVIAPNDEGWDSGTITIEIVSGSNADDVLVLREAEGITLVDDEPVAKAVTPRSSVVASSSASPRGARNLGASARPSEPSTPAGASKETGKEEPSASKPAPKSATKGDLKSVWRQRATEKVRQLAQARQRTHDDLRSRVLEQIRTNRRATVTERVERSVHVNDTKIGTVMMWPGGLSIHFLPQTRFDSAKPRAPLCQVRRREVEKIVRNIMYQNVDDNPSPEVPKTVRVAVSDGLPHRTIAALRIQLEPIDDATELRRLNNEPRLFRAHGFEDEAGFALFDDVTLYDPDTFAFNGATIRVELVGGGDPRFDQLGLLTHDQQRMRGLADMAQALSHSISDRVHIGKRAVATVHIEPPSAGAASAITVRFDPYPPVGSMAPAPEGVDVQVPLYPKTLEELAGNPFAISILDVERVVQSLTYTSIAPNTKSGMRIYQLQLHVDDNDSRIKSWVDVHPPLLSIPEYGAELQYREGRPPLSVFPKAVLAFEDAKQVFKVGEITATIASGFQPGADQLYFQAGGKGTLSIDAKLNVYQGKEYIGHVTRSDRAVTLVLDWASKGNVKTLQQFIRGITFENGSQDPTTEQRSIELVVAIEKNAAPSKAIAAISVVAEDNPTEITLPNPRTEVVRAGPRVLFCEDAAVVDPDTEVFYDPSYVAVELKGGNPTCDQIWIDGVPVFETLIVAPDGAPELPPKPADDRPGTGGSLSAPTPRSTTSRRTSVAGGASRHAALATEAAVAEVRAAGKRVIATLERLDGKRVGVIVHIRHCNLAELAAVVKRLFLRCDIGGPRDREGKKVIQLSVQSGTAPVFRTTIGVDVLPTLIELPTMVLAHGLSFSGAPVEPFGSATVPAVHCEAGATLSIAVEGGMTEAELASGPYVLTLTNKLGLTMKETKETGKASSEKAATVATAKTSGQQTLMLDGKRVGTAVFTGKHQIQVRVPGSGAASVCQKMLRSVTFMSMAALETEVVLSATLKDTSRQLAFTAAVVVGPPALMRTLSKRANSVALLSQVTVSARKHNAANAGTATDPSPRESLVTLSALLSESKAMSLNASGHDTGGTPESTPLSPTTPKKKSAAGN